MNKTLLSAALIAGFGVAALAPQTASAVDGTVTITGTITANTCSAGTAPVNIAVVLPTVQTSALTGAVGNVAGSTPFSISVTGCPVASGHTVAAYFEPAQATIDTSTHDLKNSTGNATGVEVQLLNGTGAASGGAALSQILLGNPQSTQNSGLYTVSGTGAATMNYYAQYYSSLATVTAGTVATTATFTLLYN